MSLKKNLNAHNYIDFVLLLFFLMISLLRLLYVCTPFLFITRYFSTLMDYESSTVFYAFTGLLFPSLFISFSFIPLAVSLPVDIDSFN